MVTPSYWPVGPSTTGILGHDEHFGRVFQRPRGGRVTPGTPVSRRRFGAGPAVRVDPRCQDRRHVRAARSAGVTRTDARGRSAGDPHADTAGGTPVGSAGGQRPGSAGGARVGSAGGANEARNI